MPEPFKMSSSIRKVLEVSKIDANSRFWTLPMDELSQLLTTFNTPLGKFFHQDAIQFEPSSVLFSVLHGPSLSKHQLHN